MINHLMRVAMYRTCDEYICSKKKINKYFKKLKKKKIITNTGADQSLINSFAKYFYLILFIIYKYFFLLMMKEFLEYK
jgi:hypothetical protein